MAIIRQVSDATTIPLWNVDPPRRQGEAKTEVFALLAPNTKAYCMILPI
jgi:hypothetical protein